MYKFFIKRVIDFIIALISLILASPLLILLVLLLYIFNKGNVLFLQKRPGKAEKVFTIVKFKTMTDERDKQGKLLPDAQRLTALGKFIRSTSLDEIPQLINVLKGDMSLIGPRPLLEKYIPLYSAQQARRHEVRPGITGWAQINGRNAISWELKFKYDVWYVDNISLMLDVKILYLTIKNVIIRRDINMPGTATTSAFTGNN